MATATEVRAMVEKLLDAFNAGDVTAVDALVARSGNVLGIGSDPDEWWSGRDRLLSILGTQMAEMAGARWELGESICSEGWMAGKTDVVMPDGTRVPGRLTVSCTPEGQIEHFHFSVGVSNEDAIGQELTT